MKFVSFEASTARASYGLLRGDEIVDLGPAPRRARAHAAGAAGRRRWQDEAARHARARPTIACPTWRLLPLIPQPGPIACVGHNYEEHRIETQRDPTEHPSIFLRHPRVAAGRRRSRCCARANRRSWTTKASWRS